MFQWRYYFKRKTPQTYRPVILVTGCTSGLGLATAELLYHKTNYRIVITGRRASLGRLKGKFKENERFWIRPLDVTSAQERKVLLDEISAKWDGVDILVNNAGISYRAVVEHMSEDDELLQMSTNYLGPVALIKAVLPHMREQGRGKIINISSVSGMLAMPTMASYSASKYALEGLSESLWYEAKPFGINVVLIQPGFIRSNSFRNVYYSKQSDPTVQKSTVYRDYYQNMGPFIAKLMRLSFTPPESIANLILNVIRTENPPLWIPASLDAWAFYYLRRIVPRRLLMPLLFSLLPRSRTWGLKHTNRRQ
ncbi:MAG: SDR family oxidoreductase [Bdellovibrionales bacterium]